MPQIETLLRAEDSEVRSRLIDLKVRGKTIVTPRRTLCLTLASDSESKGLRRNDRITAFNELPKEIDKKKIEDIDNDKDKQEDFYREIRYRFTGIDTSEEVTFFVYTYSNRGQDERNKQPTATETDYICSLLNHPFNDIWVPPIVPKLSGKSYIPYLKDFFETTKSYQNIPCAGLIPHISRLEVRQISDIYVSQGLNYLVMDFAGKHPLDLVGNINEVLKMVGQIEKEHNTTCILHAINVPITKAHWNNQVVPAKDILLFEMGFNCFGSSHIRRIFPREVAERIKSIPRNSFRLFNRRDYGYYRNDTSNLDKMLVEDLPTIVSLDSFRRGITGSKLSSLEKLFNVERHGLESNEIRKRLIEGESVSKYIQEKTMLPSDYIKKVMRAKKQYTL